MDNIELRSEKVRILIGEIPPLLIRIGTLIITLIAVMLFLAFYLIPYPTVIETHGIVNAQKNLTVYVPYKFLYLMDKPLNADITLEGHGEIIYSGEIIGHSSKPIHRNNENYFIATAKIKNTNYKIHNMETSVNANVKIILDDKTLWQRFIQ